MDLGLYMLKMPFRKVIGFLLPFFKKTNPNVISLWLIPVGLAMLASFYAAITLQMPIFFLIAVLLGFLRMIVATLDGMVAVTYNKSTTVGDILNRATPELCDLMLYVGLVWLCHRMDMVGIGVIAMSWAITFFGLFGAASGCPVQSVGPTGQTDRLAAVMLFSFLQYFSNELQWGVNFMNCLFYWILLGGVITLLLRFQRTYKAALKKDQSLV